MCIRDRYQRRVREMGNAQQKQASQPIDEDEYEEYEDYDEDDIPAPVTMDKRASKQPQGRGRKQEITPQMAAMAVIELENQTDLFRRLTDQCFRKCVSHYNESELSKGEITCAERCVYKFMETHKKLYERISKVNGQM
eukprot:TRINITY_DN2791_c0_g1_i1.p1 TRINITY_DN2791_c0_g1~~TRINITY_DN2791_c0_g1_i1.p1  ORF type:complete len:138 (-),score=36.53 TRINITY_DN2791_c0_g1_i1:116-529(-)